MGNICLPEKDPLATKESLPSGKPISIQASTNVPPQGFKNTKKKISNLANDEDDLSSVYKSFGKNNLSQISKADTEKYNSFMYTPKSDVPVAPLYGGGETNEEIDIHRSSQATEYYQPESSFAKDQTSLSFKTDYEDAKSSMTSYRLELNKRSSAYSNAPSDLENKSRFSSEDARMTYGLDSRYLELLKYAARFLDLSIKENEEGYESFEQIYKGSKDPHRLAIYYKNYLNDLGAYITHIRFEWLAACPPQDIVGFIEGSDEHSKLETWIDTATQVEPFEQNPDFGFRIGYFVAKKLLMTAPRDFVYLKSYRKMDDTMWYDAIKSIGHSEYPIFSDKVRGEIILCGSVYKVEGKSTRVKTTVEIDLKSMSVPEMVLKNQIKSSVKTYVNDIYKRLSKGTKGKK